MVNYKVKSFVLVLVITMLVLTPILFVCCDKPSIHDASMQELQRINGIGEDKAQDIMRYLAFNTNADTDDLINVEGIGETLVNKLKERYK